MVDLHNKNIDVVYGARNNRDTDSIFKRITAQLFYKFMIKMGVELEYNHVQAHLIVKDLLKGYSTKLYAYCVWFWYTMPFKKAISLKWNSVRYFVMEKHVRR